MWQKNTGQFLLGMALSIGATQVIMAQTPSTTPNTPANIEKALLQPHHCTGLLPPDHQPMATVICSFSDGDAARYVIPTSWMVARFLPMTGVTGLYVDDR